MRSRIYILFFVASVAAVLSFPGLQARAEVFGINDDVWKGPAGGAWTSADTSVWFDISSGTMLVPRNSGGFGRRAIIGTDYPSGVLAGSAVITTPLSGVATQIAGIGLGVRERDFTLVSTDPGFFPFPAPAAGTLTGTLNISTGTLNSVAAADATQSANGANGSIQVGQDGRGYLTMTGGTLNATGLTVAGENVSTGNGTSLLSLSGNATLSISGASTFNRRLSITGPSVNFSSTGTVRLNSTDTYNAVITSATAHSPIKAGGNVILGGSLNVNFSGLATNPAVGQTWNLFDYAGGLAGSFSNAALGADVAVTGLPQPVPLGAAFRLQKAAGGVNGKLVQLVQQQVLVLQVNRDTGELRVTNPQGGAISMDSYLITSYTGGSLKSSYKGISGAPAADTGWAKSIANATTNLAEVKQAGSFNVAGIGASGFTLGTGFDKFAVDTTLAGALGTNGEDLTFSYGDPASSAQIKGQIQYIGTKFENNLVLSVNPATGAATLKNDSMHALSFDGYSILSSTNSLTSGGFTGIGGAWEKTTGQAPASLSESNPHGPITVAAGGTVSLGNIGAAGTFNSAAAQAGLSLQFIRDVAAPASVAGDYNSDGVVDAADYVVWRLHNGQTFALPNEDPSSTPGTVTIEDYSYWKAHFGATGGSGFVGEDTFRTGVVQFTTAPTLPGAGAAVPEPTTNVLMLIGFGGLLVLNRRRIASLRPQPVAASIGRPHRDQTGVAKMSREIGFCAAAAAALTAFFVASAVQAQVVGITLTNGDFEQPGPVGTKTLAFDNTGAFVPGSVPGWTFTGGSGNPATGETNAGVGNELFGDNVPGDSGTEGGGNPGNELVLSTFDGKVFQTSAINIAITPANQVYRLSFDAHDIFTTYNNGTSDTNQYGSPLVSPSQLTARLYYGASRTTLLSQAISLTGTNTNYVMTIPVNAGNPGIGQPIGVEFDTTTYENSVALNTSTGGTNPVVSHGWSGVDNVILQVAGVANGDLNGDGLVNINDYRVIRDNLQTSSLYLSKGDLTGDGKVDLNDFRAWTKIAGPLPGSGAGAAAGGAVPEPSSWFLALCASVGIASVVGRRHIGSSRRLRASLAFLIALLVALISAGRAHAVQLAYDAFNDTNGNYTDGPIGGQNPNIGPASPSFFSGGWTNQGFTVSPTHQGPSVVSTSLSYLGKAGVGGSLSTFDAVTGNPSGEGRADRLLNGANQPQALWDSTTNGTFYLGFEVNFGTVGTGTSMGYHGIEFFPTGVTPGENRIADISYNEFFSSFGASQTNAATAKLQFNFPSGQKIVDGAPDSYNLDGVTHLIVLKFVFSSTAASDAISMYLDPTSSTEPDIANVSVAGVDFTLGSIGVAQFGDVVGSPLALDELRVGTTFADTLPAFPVPGDTDGNGTVDLVDYQHIVDHMGLRGQSTLNGDVAKGDGTQGVDGIVDINDFRLWKSHFPFPGAGSGALSGGTVPEPSTLMLAVLGAIGCLFKLARK